MPKRPYSDDDCGPAIKKVISEKNSVRTQREIKSHSAERTLQLLYEGTSKYYESIAESKKATPKCFCTTIPIPIDLETQSQCQYCDKIVCPKCTNICYKCGKDFCPNCSFLTYDGNESACYTCYR